jgi:LmbE family N-acetylglucosaminyl deacetylase
MQNWRLNVTEKRIVVFAPHPDDETLGCGGTLAKRLREGFEVWIVVLTRGQNLMSVVFGIYDSPNPDQVCEIRREETRQATKILGVPGENLIFWDYDDGALDAQEEDALEQMLNILREKKPGEVYCTNQYEGHPDHKAASSVVRKACALHGSPAKLYEYIIGLKHGTSVDDIQEPIEEIDISAELSLKREAVNVFKSHLDVLSDVQPHPVFSEDDIASFLQPVESFVITDYGSSK